MKAHRGPLPVACVLLIALCANSPARATIDLTGQWIVKGSYSFGPLLWNFAQAGTTVTYTYKKGGTFVQFPSITSDTGSIDLGTGIVSFGIGTYCGNPDGLTLQIAPDGNSFTGERQYSIVASNFECIGLTLTYEGARCAAGNSSTGCALLPGGGDTTTDCLNEWVTPRGGIQASTARRARLECTDGDPSCDFGSSGDNFCVFRIGMCFNVADPGLSCSAGSVQRVRLRRGHEAQRAALEARLPDIGGHIQGICVHQAGVTTPCRTDADCNFGAICKRLVTFGAGLTGSDVCTPLASIAVPASRGRGGQLTLRMETQARNSNSFSWRTDRDTLRLVCRPHP